MANDLITGLRQIKKHAFSSYFGIKKQNHYNKYFIKILYSMQNSQASIIFKGRHIHGYIKLSCYFPILVLNLRID